MNTMFLFVGVVISSKQSAASFFNVHFNDSALPSKTSNLRFADQAHGIARLHISEALS